MSGFILARHQTGIGNATSKLTPISIRPHLSPLNRHTLSVSLRLGIIGGGQLALYMCQAAQRVGAQVTVFAEQSDAPAIALADNVYIAEIDDTSILEVFLASCDAVTFDKESIPDKTLSHLEDAAAGGYIAVQPRAQTLRMLKDKGLQKTWLIEQDLPTLPFWIMSGDTTPGFLTEKFGNTLVQKARCGGYDGRGVQIIRSPHSPQQFWDVPSIVEPYLPGCREISVVTVRDQSGDIQIYPPVEMTFDPVLHSVKTVSMPASLSTRQYDESVALARRVVNSLKGVGVFAIEMFITPREELVINEISPRVHNSAHVTMDACNISQFDQHVRAVLGLPLVPVNAVAPAAVMLNILYTPEMREYCPPEPATVVLPDLNASIYWYGKRPGQAGRKMGHVNALGTSIDEAMARAHSALGKHLGNGGERAA